MNMCRNFRLGIESDFHHLDFFLQNVFGVEFYFQKGEFLEELCISKRYWHVRCKCKKLSPELLFFCRDFLGDGVNDSTCVENLDLAPKVTSTIWIFFCKMFSGSNFIFQKVRFWRSYEFPSVIGTSRSILSKKSSKSELSSR